MPWIEVLKSAHASHAFNEQMKEQDRQRKSAPTAKPFEVTPRAAAHWALVAMAMDSHCGEACIQCAGQGKTYYIDTMQHAVCPWCHGFGKRELKPARPSYTVHGAVGPMSMINMGPVA